jgi:hypothetical protein
MINILFKIGILCFLENYINEWCNYTKYLSNILKFAVYRSLCCLFLFIYATINLLLETKASLIDPIAYYSPFVYDLNTWFLAYVLVDMIFMIFYKIGRKDLWFHHIFFFFGVLYYLRSFATNLVLLGEALSVFSAFDLFYIENKLFYKSFICKKIRVVILKYIRLPVWIYLFIIVTFIFLKTLNIYYLLHYIVPISGFFLDRIWYNKCMKVINKYERQK